MKCISNRDFTVNTSLVEKSTWILQLLYYYLFEGRCIRKGDKSSAYIACSLVGSESCDPKLRAVETGGSEGQSPTKFWPEKKAKLLFHKTFKHYPPTRFSGLPTALQIAGQKRHYTNFPNVVMKLVRVYKCTTTTIIY